MKEAPGADRGAALRKSAPRRMDPSSVSAFTLMELLVVMAIIMILAGILMPALSTARQKAKQTVCTNNLRECGAALAAYAADFNGNTPIAIDYTDLPNQQVYWHEALFDEYLKSRKLLVCPSQSPYKYEGRYTTYGMPYQISPSVPIDEYLSVQNGAYFQGFFMRMFSLRHPSETICLADSLGVATAVQVYYVGYRLTSEARIHLRHTGGSGGVRGTAQTLFADGHVEACGGPRLVEAILKEMAAGTEIYVMDRQGSAVQLNP